MSNNQGQFKTSKYNTMKFFLFASSLIVASTNAFSLNMVSTPPSKNPRIGSKLRYSSGTEDVPIASPELDNKVKDLLKPKQTTTKETTKGLPNLREVNSREELKAAVLEDEHKLTVVRYYAPYCKSCKAMESHFYAFARRNPSINFIEVPYTKDRSNRLWVSSLGIPSFPYAHVYHPASLGLVEEHSINSKYWKDFTKVIESYEDGGCD